MYNVYILVLFLVNPVLPAMPEWYVADVANRFPGYFIGKGFAEIREGNLAEAQLEAKNQALKDAASLIHCRVSGETISHSSESGSGVDAAIEDYFLSETEVRTDLEIMGYKVFKQENDDRFTYALIGIAVDDMKNTCTRAIDNDITAIKTTFDIAENQSGRNPQKSIESYKRCLSHWKKLDDDLKVYFYLNNWSNDFAGKIDELPQRTLIEKKLERLAGSTPKSTLQLAEEIVHPFLSKNGNRHDFVIYPLQYENTGFISHFGKNVSELCANIITRENQWSRLDVSKYPNASIRFRGKILQMDNGVLLTMSMERENGRTDKTGEVFVNKLTCEHIGWDHIKPENLEQALKNKLALYKAIQSDNALKVEMRTDKVSDGPIIYTFGEKPKIFIRSNKSCYIRLIYIFSDNTKTLLKNNYFIASDQVNQWISIPVDAVICEPTGVEQLILQASREKQPPVNYHREQLGDGFYIDIIKEDISKPVAVTRGLKLKKPEKEITEKVYQWTVFEQ